MICDWIYETSGIILKICMYLNILTKVLPQYSPDSKKVFISFIKLGGGVGCCRKIINFSLFSSICQLIHVISILGNYKLHKKYYNICTSNKVLCDFVHRKKNKWILTKVLFAIFKELGVKYILKCKCILLK